MIRRWLAAHQVGAEPPDLLEHAGAERRPRRGVGRLLLPPRLGGKQRDQGDALGDPRPAVAQEAVAVDRDVARGPAGPRARRQAEGDRHLLAGLVASAPLFSVVTPVWNGAATIPGTVASVRAQSLGDWELLLVDDASTDGSRDLAQALAAADPRIRLIERETNGGAAAARNAAIRAARGRLIAFLDADDRWHPEKLARQAAFIAAGGHGLVFSAYRRVAADGTPLGVVRPPARVGRDQLLRGNVIGCLTAVYDTAVFGKAEMPDLRRRQDYGLWLRLLRQVAYAHSLPEVLADYRVAPASLSGGKLGAAAATWRLYREAEGLGRPRAAFYLGHNLVRAALKRTG